MGLEERRKIKELQDNTFPERVKEIEEICGTAIPYEVDWDSLADDPQGLNYIDNISCHRLNMALRVICQDDLGKEAVREHAERHPLEWDPIEGCPRQCYEKIEAWKDKIGGAAYRRDGQGTHCSD